MRTSLKNHNHKLFSRGVILTLAFAFAASFTVTQQVSAHHTVASSVRCSSITQFSTNGIMKLQKERATMLNVFELNIKFVKTSWEAKDAKTEASRTNTKTLFRSLLSAYEKISGKTDKQKAAMAKYKTDMLTSYSIYNDEYDTAQATYREDMLATIKALHEDLTIAVDKRTGAIKNAMDVAKKDCERNGSALTLASAVRDARKQLGNDGIKAGAKALKRAVQIFDTRHSAIKESTKVFKTSVGSLTKDLVTAVHGRQ